MVGTPVNPANPEPLHHQMRNYIIDKITSGEWAPNRQIDGELVLAKTHGVSRATVRQAILSLVQDGHLYRRQGKGTYVAERKINLNVFELRFAPVEDSIHELLSVEIEAATEERASELQIEVGAPLTVLRRLRFIHGERVAVETSHLESERFPGAEERFAAEDPLIDILARDFDTFVTGYQASLEPVLLNLQEQEHLHYFADDPLGLLLTRVGSDANGSPVVSSQSIFRGDRCRAIFNHQ